MHSSTERTSSHKVHRLQVSKASDGHSIGRTQLPGAIDVAAKISIDVPRAISFGDGHVKHVCHVIHTSEDAPVGRVGIDNMCEAGPENASSGRPSLRSSTMPRNAAGVRFH